MKGWADTFMKRPRGRTHLTAIISIALLLGFPFPALPGLIPSRATSYVSLDKIDSDRLTASPAIDAETLRTGLLAFGCSRDQLRVILDRASPQDLHQLARHLEQLKAAGGTRNRVWTVVAIVILVLAILLLASENALHHQHFVSGH
jgi:hypothetical protein